MNVGGGLSRGDRAHLQFSHGGIGASGQGRAEVGGLDEDLEGVGRIGCGWRELCGVGAQGVE